MSDDRRVSSSLRRHLLGASGLACLATGIFLLIWPPDSASAEFMQGSFIKSGLALLAAWLAFPQLDRVPGWMFVVMLLLILVIATRPQIALVLVRVAVFFLPIFFVIWLLRPKARRRSAR
jgi:hypothetical protein